MGCIRWVVLLLALVTAGCVNTTDTLHGHQGSQADDNTGVLGQMRQADQAYSARHWNKARRAYESVVDNDPDNARALFRLGVLAYRRSNLNRARKYFRRARSVNDAGHPRATYDLGILNLRRAYVLLDAYAGRLEKRSQASGSSGTGAKSDGARERLRAIRKLRSAIDSFRDSGGTAQPQPGQ